jgi:PAT family beta-lactamase induction signal transducer AmpG
VARSSRPTKPGAPHGKDLAWTATTNFGEGLPWTVLHQVSLEFLTAIGASKTQISSTSLLHLPGTFRFAWSPIVDLMGRKRTWIWVTQLLLGVGILAVSSIVPVARPGHLRAFWTVLTVIAFLSATHDIACDGFYLQALNKHDQALYSGVRGAAFRTAMWVGRSLLVVLAGLTAWFWSYAAAGALMLLVALVNAALMPRPPEHHPQDDAALEGGAPSGGLSSAAAKRWAFLAAYRTFLTQPNAVLVLSFMLVYRLGDIMMFAMSTPMLKDIGIGTAQRGVLASFQMVGFMTGSIVGGAVIARYGLARCLVPMTYIQNFAIPLYALLAYLKPGFWGVVPFIVVEQIASGVGTAASAVFIMQRCRSAFSASHFAFATSIVSLASTFSGYLSGPLNEALGHPRFFLATFVASIPGLVLVYFVPKTPVEPA